MNSTPQVQTVEISDAELDNVSGGLAPEALGTVAGVVNGIPAVASVAGAVVGTVDAAACVHAAPGAGLAVGL